MLLLLLASCTRGDDAARLTAEAAVEPRIVVQLGHQLPVVAVRWVDGGRHLVSIAEDGTIVFWDWAGRAILDTAQVPGRWEPMAPDRLLLRRVAPGADGRSLELVYRRGVTVDEQPGSACPPEARQEGDLWCSYSLDLATRVVTPDRTIAPPKPVGEGQPREIPFPLSPDGAWRPMPNHDDGMPGLFDVTDEHLQFSGPSCASEFRCRYGVNLVATSGEQIIALTGDQRSYFLDADISPDGQRLVRVEGLSNETEARVSVLDMMAGTSREPFEPSRAYHRVSWLGDGSFALSSQGYDATNDMPAAQVGFPPTLVVDAGCARSGTCRAIDAYGEMTPLDDAGGFIGLASLAGCYRLGRFGPASINCQYAAGRAELDRDFSWLPSATRVSIHAASRGGWRPMHQPDLGDQVITAIALSPDRLRIAIATRVWENTGTLADNQVLRVLLFEREGDALDEAPRELVRIVDPLGATRDQLRFEDAEGRLFVPSVAQALERGALGFDDSGVIQRLGFTPDGTKIAFSQTVAADDKATLYVLDVAGAKPPLKVANVSLKVVPTGERRILDLDNRALIDNATGRLVARLAGTAALHRAGYIERGNLVWAATEDGTIEFYDAADGSRQLTFYMLADDRFFAVTPSGRYDTNLGPDTDAVRWLVPDAPWQSLAPQTFMRDFYEPGLYGKLLECRAARTCARMFRPLPSITSLNRVLPEVEIVAIAPAADPRSVIVTLEVTEGVDEGAANGKTRSGVFNPRLFVDEKLVAMTGGEPQADERDLESWRRANDAGPVRRFTYTIPLPTGEENERPEFTAYAFNEDRIKGATTRAVYRPSPPLAPRHKRAFIIAIGIDDYDVRRFRLNYAVADARLLAERLGKIQGYETRQLVLAGERLGDGRRRRIDKATIISVLALLDGSRDRASLLASLRRAGIDASPIEPATPDDLVIVSFSGHGWADPLGNFYLVPTGGAWAESDPDTATLVSSADLVRAFSPVRAADMALIIDACHSSASVANGRFKPGPMGDSGLGQLAFDKGLSILAATQADDVARENARLGQGLLTYALAAEGLATQGLRADLDGDGAIRLTEWLGYAVQRLPVLSEETALAAGPAARGRTGRTTGPCGWLRSPRWDC